MQKRVLLSFIIIDWLRHYGTVTVCKTYRF